VCVCPLEIVYVHLSRVRTFIILKTKIHVRDLLNRPRSQP